MKYAGKSMKKQIHKEESPVSGSRRENLKEKEAKL